MVSPSSPQSNVALSSVLFLLGQTSEAISFGERAMRLNPHDETVAAEFGLHLARSGAWDRGLSYFKDVALKKTQSLNRYLFGLAEAAFFKGDYLRAREIAETISTRECFTLHLMLAMCFGQLNETERAMRALEHLNRLRPSFSTADARRYLERSFHEEMTDLALFGLKKAGLKS